MGARVIVYVITNLVTGKKYVGQTRRTIEERWREHLHSARQPSRVKMCPYLYASMNVHGFGNFTISELDRAQTLDELNDLEELWIAKLGTTDRRWGYNVSWGGASRLGPDTSAKLSAALKGKPAWNKGKPMGPEQRANMIRSGVWAVGREYRLTLKGRQRLVSSKLGKKNPNFGGKSNTPESIEKRAAQSRGKPSWNKGIPQTAEACEKMRGPRPSLMGPRPHRRGANSSKFRQDVSTEAIKQLRSIGFSPNKIARLVGCSHGTVTNRLKGWPESETT